MTLSRARLASLTKGISARLCEEGGRTVNKPKRPNGLDLIELLATGYEALIDLEEAQRRLKQLASYALLLESQLDTANEIIARLTEE